MKELITVSTVPEGIEDADLYLKNLRGSMAASTFEVYAKQWKYFTDWCEINGRTSLPASSGTVAKYIDYLRDGHSRSTITQAAAAISRQHKASGLYSPVDTEEVKVALRAAARSVTGAPYKKAALTLDLLVNVLSSIPRLGMRNIRDRALLAVGFMGGFRRSELAALRVNDLSDPITGPDGRLRRFIAVRHSKTDQNSKGMTKCIFSGGTVDAVAELNAWLTASELSGDAPIFPRIRKGDKVQSTSMSGRAVALVVKDRATAVGLNLDVSGHSLRRGFITSAIRAGASERSIMNQTGHRRTETLREYYERQDAGEDNAAAII